MRVLLVCLGNICRSPMAEGLLRTKLDALGLADRVEVDSAGTSGHHAGEPADPRTVEVLRRRGGLVPLRSRQVRPQDFERFDVILAMDRSNLRRLQAACPPRHREKLALCLAPLAEGGEVAEVPDPYYGGPDGFDHVYDLLDAALDAWIDRWRPSLGEA